MLLAALVVPWASRAQETVTIGTGTTNQTGVPFNSLYHYSFVEQVYLASDIDMAGTITKVKFYLNQSYSTVQTNNITLWMKNVSRTSFSTTTDYEPVTTSDVVYNGSWTIPANYTGWVEIELTTPFQYDGVSNLMVAMHEYTSGYQTRNFATTSGTNRALSFHSDSANPDPYNIGSYSGTKTLRAYYANMQLEITAGDISCYGVKSLHIVPSMTTANSMTLSWVDTNEVTYTVVNMADTSIIASGITDTFYTINNLTANTTYNFGVYAKCAEDDSSRIVTVSGRTPCAAITSAELPYFYGFEDSPSSGATQPISPCWTKGTNNTTAYPYPYSTYKHSGLYGLYMYSTSTYYCYAAMPAFEDDISSLYLTFWGYKTVAASGKIIVGVMSDPQDVTTIDTVAILNVNALSTWEMLDVNFSDYTGDGGYIVFFLPKGATNTVYIDDITVMPVPTCMRPMAMGYADLTDEEVTISWNAVSGVSDYTVLYGTTDFDPVTATNVLSEATSDTIITLTGLTAQTTYWVKVAANCTDGSSSLWSQISFKTRCAPTAVLPYSYGFEDASGTTSTSTINPCWNKGTNNTTAYPYPYGTYKHTGTKSLYMNSTTAYWCYAAMPAFVQPIDSLMVTFWGYKTLAASGKIIVGVMSNPNDITTFDTVAELFIPATSTWKEFEVPMLNYTGNGRYIAFFTPAGASNTVYIDDITVDYAPNCLLPENVHVANLTSNAATVEWTSVGEYQGWLVKYSNESFNPATSTTAIEEEVTTNSVSLTNLMPNTTYYLYVQTICTDDSTEWSDPLTFTTFCEPVDELPWFFDPDSLSTTSSATNIPCFSHIGGGYVNIATRTGFTGNTVRFYPNSSTAPNILVLPEFDLPISSLYMTYKTAPEGASSGSISVGYITDIFDSTTFVALGTYPVSAFNGSGSVVPQMLDMTFANAPEGARIAFRHNVNATGWYWFLDEITVLEMPTCVPPETVTLSFLGTTATLNMASGSSSEYIIVLNAPLDTTILVNEDTYDLENLVGGQAYSGRVYSYCDGDTSYASTPFSFTMPCSPIADMPWIEDFNTITNINQLLCWDRYTGLYNDTAAFELTPTTSGWLLHSAHGMDGSQHVKMNIYGTSAKYWIVTPPFEIGGDMSLTFDYSLTTYNSDNPMDADVTDDRFIVFAITADTTFVPLGKWGSNTTRDDYSYAAIPNTPTFMRFDLDDFDGEVVRFAFYGESTASGDDNDLHVDNIFVGEVPECPRPDSVQVANITSNSATISWVDTNNVGIYVVTYWPEGDNLTADDTVTVNVEDTEVVLTDLGADSIYYVTVQSDCGNLSLPTSTTIFRTACTPVAATDLPYVENFDTYGTGTSAAISTCWKKDVIGSTVQYPYPYATAAVTGSAGLYFYGTSAITCYAAMPLFETPLNNLMIGFSIKRPTTASYKTILLVGVMSDPTDITTFDTVETIDLSSEPTSSIHRCLVSLENYEGEGSYIAFKAANTTSTSTYNYVYLDSVVVDNLPSCRWPSALVADSVTESSVSLSWTGTGEEYYVEASLNSDFSIIAATATASENNVTVTGLNDYSQYYFRVRNVCDDTVSFWSNTATAITRLSCGDGYTTAYDTLSYGTSTSYTYMINGYSTYNYGASWHIYTPGELEDLGLMDTINYIRGISLETGTVSNSPIRFRVYMGTTNLDEWHSSTSATSTTGLNDTLPIGSMQLVYDGSIVFAANSWNEIAFSTPYLYRADENLVVAFVRDTAVSGTTYFKYGTTNDYRTAYMYTSGSSTYAYRGKNNGNIAFISCNHIPSCPKPVDVVASNVATDGFDLAWTGTSAGYKVVVSENPMNPDEAVASDSVFIFMPTTNQVSITGLSPMTTYYYYLRSECGDEQSTWTLESNVTTLCEALAVPYYENFNGMAALSTGASSAMVGDAPQCWNWLSGGADSYIALDGTSTYRYNSTGYSIKFKSSAAVSNFLIMPAFSRPISELEVSFWTRPEGTAATPGIFEVGYMTDVNDSASFVMVEHYAALDFGGAYKFKSALFTNAPAGARITFRHKPTNSNMWWFLDEIDVHEAPSCFLPDSVTVSDITQNSAIVRWVDHRNQGCTYEVEYGESGFAHGHGTSVTTTADSLAITGLDNSSHYQVYVRSICAADDITDWISEPVAFNTLCGPVSLPYSNDWEAEATGSANMALCWNSFHNTGSTNYPYINASNGHNGAKSLYYYFYNYSTNPTDEAYISPEIDTATYPINNIEVNFWAKSTVAGKHIMVGVMSGSSNMSTFTLIDTIALTTTYTEYYVNTSAYTGNGDRIVFRAMMDNLASSSSYYIYVDEVTIDQLPPCPRVFDLTATNGTQSSVELGWTDTVANTAWVIEYAEVGSTTVNTVRVTTNPYTLTGLTPATRYTFRVAPVCGNGDTSLYSRESLVFVTTQVPATLPYSYNFEDPAEWNNWQIASNNNVKWYRGNVAYGNTTNAGYISVDNGATHSWNMNSITNSVVYRDIDFGTTPGSYVVKFNAVCGGTVGHNYDGISLMLVDPTVPVESYNTALTSPWGRIALVYVHMDTNWNEEFEFNIDNVSGVKRVAFIHFNNSYGSTYPYVDIPSAIDNITIVPQECPRPYDLTVSNLTSSSATLSWAGEDSLYYQVQYKVVGGTAQNQIVNGNSYTLTGLSAITDYEWWVRKICDTTAANLQYSAWSSKGTFKTLCGFATLPYSENFDSVTGVQYNQDGVLPDCWERYTSGTDDNYLPHVTGSGSWHFPHSGTNCLTMTSGSGATQGSVKVAVMPPFAVPLNSLHLKFWYRYESATSGTLTVGYVTDLNDLDGSFVTVKTIAGTTTHIQDSVTFETAPANAMQIAFRWEHNSTFYSVGIDDIEVWSDAPVCNAPDSATVVAMTFNSAELTWNDVADSFEVHLMQGEWNEPVSGTVVDTNAISFSNLAHSQAYAFGVRSICGTGLTSDWTVTYFFTDNLPCYVPTNVAVSNVGYNTATVSFTPGLEQTQWEIHLFGGASTDVNQVVTDNSYTFNNLVIGTTYQVAVRAICSATENSEWSDTVSFTTTDCAVPTNVDVDQITATTARVTWNGSATSYLVEYGMAGYSQGHGTQITVTGTSANISGLDPETMYDVYVKSVCADGVGSLWSIKKSFTTTEQSGTYYTLTVVSNNPAWGTVTGGSEYPEGYVATITATPNSGYRFVEWQEDHDTNSIRNVTVTGDATYTAIFAENVGIDAVEMSEVSLFPNPASSMVTIRANGMEQVSVIDLNGSTVVMQSVDSETFTFDVSNLAKGAYFVRITGGEGTVVRKLIVK